MSPGLKQDIEVTLRVSLGANSHNVLNLLGESKKKSIWVSDVWLDMEYL